MYCYKCGKENKEEARFCKDCGAELKDRSVLSSATEEKSDSETCKNCGKELPHNSKFCRFCGQNQSDNATVSEVDITPNKKLKPASWIRRFINFVLDLIGYYLFAFPVGYVFGLLFGPNVFDNVNDVILGLFVAATYYIIFESLLARSPAKFITRTKVVNLEGKKPDFGQVLGRTFSRFIPFEIFSFLEANPIGWHDKLPKTMVVNDE
ncbi:MAG TPA: RDD family protein [Candidatus Nanoarchaeia archaeon]